MFLFSGIKIQILTVEIILIVMHQESNDIRCFAGDDPDLSRESNRENRFILPITHFRTVLPNNRKIISIRDTP